MNAVRGPRPLTILGATALVVVLMLPVALAHAASKELTAGINQQAESHPWKTGCTATARVWAQEFGESGINRFRAQWELRSPYDNGWLPTYAKTGWAYTVSFPNDHRSRHAWFTLPAGYLNFAKGKEFSLWIKVVGERPSFWQRDVVRKYKIGSVACPIIEEHEPDPSTTTPPPGPQPGDAVPPPPPGIDGGGGGGGPGGGGGDDGGFPMYPPPQLPNPNAG